MKITKIKLFYAFLFLVFVIPSVSIPVLYNNDNFYSRLVQSTKINILLPGLIPFLDDVMREFSLKRSFNSKNLDPKNYIDLMLSGSDLKDLDNQIEFFKDLGHIKDEFTIWRKAKIRLPNEELKIKYKLHGTSATDLRRSNKNFSLRVKHKKEGPYLENMREYTLKNFVDSLSISTVAINKAAHDFGLISPHGRMVILRINGVNVGLFMLVEHHDKEWFERIHGITNYSIIKSNDDWDRKERSSWSGHDSDSDLLINNKEISGSSELEQISLGRLKSLLDSVDNNDLESFKSLVDLDYLAKFMAFNTIINNNHHTSGDNLKYIYDFSSGKFKFLFRIEDTLIRMRGGIADFNSIWSNSNQVDTPTNKVFEALLRDSSFRFKRDKYLLHLLDNREGLIKELESTFQENYPTVLSSKLSLQRYKYNKNNFFKDLNYNLDLIHNYLNYNKVFVSINETNDIKELSIFNDSFSPLVLDSLILDEDLTKKDDNELKVSEILPSPNLDRNLLPLNIVSNIVLDTKSRFKGFKFKNYLTGKEVAQNNIYINRFVSESKKGRTEFIGTLQRNNISYKLDSNNLLIKKGTYAIREDIIFPEGISTVIEEGTVLRLDKEVSILFQGNFTAIGTKGDPIIVKRLNKKHPFGTFAALGHEDPLSFVAENFFIEGGSERILNGVQFTGQLSIHNSIVNLKRVKVSKSISDDGLNVRNGKVKIQDSLFVDNLFDQIDLDFCTGEVSNNLFSYPQIANSDNNGDGLDVSGSKLQVFRNTYKGFKDKSMSVGERSYVLVDENVFIANKSAIAIKDASKAFILNNDFRDNDLRFHMFIKKPFFEEPSIFLLDKPKENTIEIESGMMIIGNKEKLLENYERL